MPIIGDRTVEPDETFVVALANPSGATLARDTATVTIVNDDRAVASSTRATPRGLSARATPTRARRLPYRFTLTGRLTLPAGVGPSACRNGRIAAQVKAATKTISTRRATLDAKCRYTIRLTFTKRTRLGTGRLKVTVRFLGTARLSPLAARRPVFLRAG